MISASDASWVSKKSVVSKFVGVSSQHRGGLGIHTMSSSANLRELVTCCICFAALKDPSALHTEEDGSEHSVTSFGCGCTFHSVCARKYIGYQRNQNVGRCPKCNSDNIAFGTQRPVHPEATASAAAAGAGADGAGPAPLLHRRHHTVLQADWRRARIKHSSPAC